MALHWLKRRTYGPVGYVSRTTGAAILKLGQELSLGKKYSSSRPAAVLSDTARPTIAGAGKHRGWDTARAIAERIIHGEAHKLLDQEAKVLQQFLDAQAK